MTGPSALGGAAPGTVDAVLLASGFSRRFGPQDKLLAPVKGIPLAQHTLALVCGMPQFSRVFFVWARPEVGALAKGFRAVPIHNPNPHLGQRESVRLGTEASAAEYYMFLPCDQPLLDEETLLQLLARRAPGRITVPAHKGTPGSPALFSRAFRPQLLAIPAGQNARSIRRRHPAAVDAVELPSPRPLLDIDTLQDLSLLEKEAP
ncbi:nucleotidyltransferase family protein [Ruminococcaceae bacterium OttesenSCG-928-O06]|nr:nucleotidyltransferase family protein [Ruminococcaceae bacterium OttesenSCG-928-O06]